MVPRYSRMIICVVWLLFAITSVACENGSPSAENQVQYVISWDITNWDPSSSYDNSSLALSNIYEPLLWYRSRGDSVWFEPALATNYDISEDGLIWTFKLRQNVRFHDGSQLTAQVVKKSIERTQQIGQGASWIWGPVDSLKVLNADEIQFKLSYPAPLDLIVSSGFAAWIMCDNHSSVNDIEWYEQGNACGTGPYRLESWSPGDFVVLRAYEDYWGGWEDEQPRVAIIRTVPESTTQLLMIRNGQADIVRQPPYDMIDMLSNAPDVRIISTPSFETIVALINTELPPTNSQSVRESVSYSVPYQQILDSVLAGYAKKPHGPVAYQLWGALPTEIPFTYDPDKANRLISETGISGDDKRFRISITSGDILLSDIALIIQESLRKLGIRSEIEVYPWSVQWARARAQETAPHLFLFYWWPTYPTPYDPLLGMFHTEQAPVYNLSRYSNTKLDSLIDLAHRITGSDREAAAELFREAQTLVLNDVPALFLADLNRIYLVRNRISELHPNPAYPNVIFFKSLILNQ